MKDSIFPADSFEPSQKGKCTSSGPLSLIKTYESGAHWCVCLGRNQLRFGFVYVSAPYWTRCPNLTSKISFAEVRDTLQTKEFAHLNILPFMPSQQTLIHSCF